MLRWSSSKWLRSKWSRYNRSRFGYACLPLAMLLAAPAAAQVSASASVWSDYRYRGASLSDGEPALQLHAGYDTPSGLYAGALLSSVRVDESRRSEAMAIAYAGWAWPLHADWHTELYFGISSRQASVRVHYSDDYFGGGSAWYAEGDLRHALSEHWHLIAHVGLLRGRQDDRSRSRRDGLIGIGWAHGNYEVQGMWSIARGGRRPYPHYSVPGYSEDVGPLLRLTRTW